MGAKRRTIAKVIKMKLDEWVNTIEDIDLKVLVKRDAFVTGGSIASMLIGEKINDFDVYFKTKETTIAVARYYVAKFKEEALAKGKHYEPQVRTERIKNLNGDEEERVTIWIQSAGAVGASTNPDGLPSASTEDDSTGATQEYAYFETQDNANGDSADSYVEELMRSVKQEDGEGSRTKGLYRPVFMSQNAITLSDKIQLVVRFYGQPEDIYKNYDFVHVMQHYDYETNTVHLNEKALESLLSRTLIYTGSLYPICSVFRAKKFIERGWKISAGQYLKMCYQIAKINFNDMSMLREMLTGVDAAYFHQLIRLIEDHKSEREKIGCQDIDGNYLVQLIDQIFET